MQATSNDAKRIFAEAIENHTAAEWSGFLREACGGDAALRSRVECLLDAHQTSDPFLDGVAEATHAETDGTEESIGTLIGPYKLLQRIGEGGFGVVYMAEQTRPVRRKVALKVIKPGMDCREVIIRFEAERQALALMDHPNIATVLDVGQTESGRPYLAMELVKGIPVTEYADTNHLSTEQRLRLFALICRAVHHAHQKGVIHRDLKPSNVMVTLHDGIPVPKVIDFGVSKAISQPLTEKTLFTRFGQVIGTPQYMSPEQAEMSGLDVDTRSDIYSLGVILYELLTGRTPFTSEEIRDAGFDGMRRMIREKEPICPSNLVQTLDAGTATTVASNRASRPDLLRKNLRGELDWIVMRTLEKDRGRRYDSASALADDIDRYMTDEPVEASPPSVLYRSLKAYRRNRIACIAGALIASSLILATGISLVAMRESWRMTQVAVEQQQIADDQANQAQEAQTQAERAKEQAEAERGRAEGYAQQAAVQARASKSTLELVVALLAKTGVNPKTGSDYTVAEALKLLAESDVQADAKFNLPPAVAAEFHMGLGMAYRRSGVDRLAALHFEQAANITRKPPRNQSLAHAAALRYLGASRGVADPIRSAITIETKHQSAEELVCSTTLLGQLLGRSEESQSEAVALLEQACSKFRPRPTAELSEIPHFILAELLHQLGRRAEAERYEDLAIENAIDCFGNDRFTWQRAGKSLRDRKRRENSNRALLVADSIWPDSADDEPAFYLGLNCMDLRDYPRAESYFQKSLRLARARDDGGRVRSSQYHLAAVLVEQYKGEQAIPLLKAVLNEDQSRNHKSLGSLMALAVDSPELSTWLDAYRRRLETEADEDPHAANLLALFETVDGNIDRAKSLLDGRKLGTDHPWARFVEEGHFDQAKEFASNWLEVIPHGDLKARAWKTDLIARAHYHIGDVAAGEHFLRQAIDVAGQMDSIDPFTLYWVKYELALLLHAQGRTDESRPLFREIVEVLEDHARNKATIWRDDYYDRITEWHAVALSGVEYDAEEWLQNIQGHLRLNDSENARSACHSLMAEHFDEQHDFQQAIHHYERESLTRPLDFRILPFQYCRDRLVDLYLQTGQVERGQKHFAKVLRRVDEGLPPKHPHRAFTRLRLAILYLEQPAKPDEAHQLLTDAKAILRRNSMTPDQVMERLDGLLVRSAKQSGQGK